MNIHALIRSNRIDAHADDCSDEAMKASAKAHKTGEPSDHQQAAFLHARSADEQAKRGNHAMAAHHHKMAFMHGDEAGPDSEEEADEA